MTDSDLEIWSRAAVSMIPYVGGPMEVLYSGYRERRVARVLEFLEPIARLLEHPEELETRLSCSDPLEALFGRAIQIAADSGLAAKRAALGKVAAAALEDEAKLDRATLLVDTLQQIEAPHVRALIELRDAVQRAEEAGEMPVRAQHAEYEIVPRIKAAGDLQDFTVLRVLNNLGLIIANESIDTWYFHDVAAYGHELLAYLDEPSGTSSSSNDR